MYFLQKLVDVIKLSSFSGYYVRLFLSISIPYRKGKVCLYRKVKAFLFCKHKACISTCCSQFTEISSTVRSPKSSERHHLH